MELISGAPAARVTDEQLGSVDVQWNRFRPLESLEGLSGDDRAAAHLRNVGRRKLDLADYARFVERFVDEARRCCTLDEYIAHGRPKIPQPPPERGARESERRHLDDIYREFTDATREGLYQITKSRAKLESRRMPLDVNPECAVGAKAKVAGRSVGVQGSLTDRSISVWYGSGRVTTRCTLDQKGARCVRNVAGVTISDRGVDSIEVSTGPAYVRMSPETVALGLKVGRVVGGDGARVSVGAEVKAGLNVQLLDAETVRRALSNEDFWAKKR
jgi:hypothetical protein